MKYRVPLLGCIVSLLIPTSPLIAADDTDVTFAENDIEVTVSLTTAQRNDVDFDTTTHTLGIKALTPYGLVLCEHGTESGDTRIDTFDNVFGTTLVSSTQLNGYDASLIKCGYGIKLPFSGGELSGGLGVLSYRGKTDTWDDGKEIELDGFRMQAKYLYGDTDTRLQLVNHSYSYNYHYMTWGHNSITTGTIRTISLQGDWGPIYAEGEHVHGDKLKEFVNPPLPLPNLDFDYEQEKVSVGPAFDNTMGPLRYIAPTYTSGSERGSYNRMTLNNGFRGAIAAFNFGGTDLKLSYLGLESAGRRDFSPVTTDITETMKSRKLMAELKAEGWSVILENKRLIHNGYISVTSTPIPYTMLTGCPVASCDYHNVRRENEWKLSWDYAYSKQIELKGGLYNRQRSDTQYHNPERKYNETGGSIGVAYQF